MFSSFKHYSEKVASALCQLSIRTSVKINEAFRQQADMDFTLVMAKVLACLFKQA